MRLITISLLLGLAACNRASVSDAEHREPDISAAKAEPERSAPASDIKLGQRDPSPSALTPDEQRGSEADRALTQLVRANFMKQDALTGVAKNVRISTASGVVTLRGVVRTSEERVEMARIAQGSDGVTEIDNQLELLGDEQ